MRADPLIWLGHRTDVPPSIPKFLYTNFRQWPIRMSRLALTGIALAYPTCLFYMMYAQILPKNIQIKPMYSKQWVDVLCHAHSKLE